MVASGASGTLEFITGSFVASTNSRMTINNTDVTVQNANLKANANTSSNYAATITNLGTGNAALTCVNNASLSASIGVTTSSNANLPSIGFFYSNSDFTITDGVTPFLKVNTQGNNKGAVTINPISRAGMAASTEFKLFVSNSNAATFTLATGALATERLNWFRAATIDFAGASTITNAANVSITGGLIKGTNASITNTHALFIEDGTVGAATNSFGITCNAQVGAASNYSAQFSGGLGILLNNIDLVLGTTTGTKIGTATSQKLAFYNSTPIIQPVNTVAINDVLVNLGLRASGGSSNFTTDIKLNNVGTGLFIKEGTNATMGTATLTAGTVTVSTTKVTANSRIYLTVNGGTLTNVGAVYISARSAGTSFAISSMNILDASDVAWVIVEPN